MDFEGFGVIQMHLNGGFTKVLLVNSAGSPLCEGICRDIPTESIPFHLRGINQLIQIKTSGSEIKISGAKE